MDAKTLIHCFPDPICRIDNRLLVLAQNPASLVRSGEMLNRPCHLTHFHRETPCAGCQAQWVFATGRPARWFLAIEAKDESSAKTYFEITLLPETNDAGETVGLIELLRDVTLSFAMEHQLIETSEQLDQQVAERTAQLEKLKRDQAALVQAEKMASLGRLVAGLTHEIHTPLGTIVSSLEMMDKLVSRHRDATGLRDDDAFAQCSELIELQALATQRITRILRSLREFAHLDRAQEEATDLHVGIDSCLALLSHELKGRIDVTRDYGDLPRVVCRPDAMNQVFMNLLQNAIQAIDSKGTIKIVTRRENERWVRLAFHDSGCGIPAEQIEHIFEPGFTTKARGVGTGLGLALSYSTMETHKGQICVESTPGSGTVFTLRLPVWGERP